MQAFVPLCYDIATVCVFLYMIAVCARRGFARTIISFVGYAAALAGATALAKPLAQAVFTALVRPAVVQGILKKLGETQLDALPQSILSAVEEFPAMLFDAIGLEKEQLVETLQQLAMSGGEGAAVAITDAVVAPLAVMLLKTVFFLLLFTASMFLVRRLMWVFSGINRLPLIGPANRILGGAVGVAQAVLTLYIIAVLLTLLVSLTKNGISIEVGGQTLDIASSSLFQRTILFKIFVNSNPLDLFLSVQSTDLLDQVEGWGRQLESSAAALF